MRCYGLESVDIQEKRLGTTMRVCGWGFLEHAAFSEEPECQNYISNMPDLSNTVPNTFPIFSVVRCTQMPQFVEFMTHKILATKEKAGLYLAVRKCRRVFPP